MKKFIYKIEKWFIYKLGKRMLKKYGYMENWINKR